MPDGAAGPSTHPGLRVAPTRAQSCHADPGARDRNVGTRTASVPQLGLEQGREEVGTHSPEGLWWASPVPGTHSSPSSCWAEGGRSSCRLREGPSPASGSPQAACADPHTLGLALSGTSSRALVVTTVTQSRVPPCPNADPACPGALLGKNHDSSAGSQGGAGCFISWRPGGMYTGLGLRRPRWTLRAQGEGGLAGATMPWGSFTRRLGDGLLRVVIVQSLVQNYTRVGVSLLPAPLVYPELAVQEEGPVGVQLGWGRAVLAL